MCYLQGDPADPDAALSSWLEAVTLGGEEAQAASLRIGEMRLVNDPRATHKAWANALAKVQKPSDYRNAYIELEKLRGLFETACRQLLESQEYQTTEQLAELYKKVALPGRSEIQLAQATESQARQLQDKKETTSQANPLFIKAAKAYEEVASLRTDQEQGEYLWRSAACYLPARQFAQAAKVLEKFVKVEKADLRLAEGWLALAEAYLALQNKDKARQAYLKCIEFPDTPFAYRARYQVALDEMDRKNFDQAIAILKQNLKTPSSNTLDREAREKSLYLLGSLLFQDQKFDQAYLSLKQAIQEYPTNPGILTARDQLAECFRKLGDQANLKAKETMNAEVREYYVRNKVIWLEQAITAYQGLADDLEMLGRKTPLSRDDLRLLRKSLFGVADIYFDLNDLNEALRRFQLLHDRYRKQVEGLIACQRIWLCYSGVREVGSPDRIRLFQEATRNAVKMAQDDLQTMDENSDAFRGNPGVWQKRNWENWITWVTAQLNQPSPSPTAAPTTK
jgi:tetratricopeptide (TPR) repeat protein